MMNNYLQFLPIVCCALLASYSPAVEIVYHHDTNALEIVHEFVAVPSPMGTRKKLFLFLRRPTLMIP